MEDYKNNSLPIEERVDDLVGRMTIEEKVAQLVSLTPRVKGKEIWDDDGNIKPHLMEGFKYGAGGIQLPVRGYSPSEGVRRLNNLQKYLEDNTRLGIPVMAQEECLHGHLAKGATSFPAPLALSCSWDMELIRSVYSTIACEARARGGHEAHTPVFDIARDARWGRTEETYGEDTYLTTCIAVEAVKGMQGEEYMIGDEHIVSAAKHFAGYAQSDGGRNFAPSYITPRYFRDQILPPFKAAVKEAGLLGIMPSHNDIDGIPCHANGELLTDILRDEWSFNGIVVSDYFDSARLYELYHMVDSVEEAAKVSLKAGLDMDLPCGSSFITLSESAKSDPSLVEYIDRAVSRVLYVKFRLGLFKNVYADEERAESIINCDAHKEVAKCAAEKSAVLLENNGILPLDKNSIKKIAVIGPNAKNVATGNYSVVPNKGIGILQGIIDKVGSEVEVVYSKGCGLTQEENRGETELDIRINDPHLTDPASEANMMVEAVETAKSADVAIVCIGGSVLTCREAIYFGGDKGDRDDITLVGRQAELVNRIKSTGTKVVVVLTNGRPLAIGEIQDAADAIIEAWYLGEATGSALADIIFGDVVPSGKLTMTFPRSVGQIPVYYSQKRTGHFKEYLFVDNTPLYPFGYGLSYTTFKYSDMMLNKHKICVGDTLIVQVDVENTGDVAGDEIVQMYIGDVVCSVVRAQRELKGFKRVHLAPREKKTVEFTIDMSLIEFTGKEMKRVVEPGEFVVEIGTSSQDTEKLSFWVEEK